MAGHGSYGSQGAVMRDREREGEQRGVRVWGCDEPQRERTEIVKKRER